MNSNQQKKKIKTWHHFGRYETIGPVCLPLMLSDGTVTTNFSKWYFGFPNERYAVLVMGNLAHAEQPLLRIESMCIWSHVFGSQYCDCDWQLNEAKQRISNTGTGIIIFGLDQHGKSIGIRNHFLLYSEGQRRNLECIVEAYESLGLDEDYRKNYSDVKDILKHFHIKKVRLMSNNPQRIKLLRKTGITVERVPLEMPLSKWNKVELTTKQKKLGHLLSLREGKK